MITAGAEIQVLVATRPVDFRNYAEPVIMWSPRGQMVGHRGLFVSLTQHNLPCVRLRSTSP
jgi:hypothetical protein